MASRCGAPFKLFSLPPHYPLLTQALFLAVFFSLPLFSVPLHIHTRGARPLGPMEQGADLLYPCCLLVTSPHLPQAQLSPTSALTTP